MNLIRNIDNYHPRRKSVVTIGNFDGIHRGHAGLIREVVNRAKALDAEAILLTFEPHTRVALSDGSTQPILSTIEEKAILAQKEGISQLICIPFDQQIKTLPAEKFITDILVKKLHAEEIVVGPDHTFGHQQGGNRISLREMLSKNDISLLTITSLSQENTVYSSTGIRDLISRGAIDEAVALSGHPYLIRAQRVPGLKNGTRMGYPTLNFAAPALDKVLPPAGIYAAELEFSERRATGALYFGNCPTFENRDIHFELHLLAEPGVTPDINEFGFLWVWRFIRNDRAFPTETALVGQIKQDIDIISRFFLEERVHANY